MVDLLDDDDLLDLRTERGSTDPKAVVDDLRPRQDLPDANDDLRQWSGTAKTTDCHLCGAKPRMQCQACGRPACSKDSWVMLGLCRTCATEERLHLWHDRNRNVSDNWLGP